jgi:hypothetical protein
MKAKTDSKLALGDLELFALESDVIRAHRCDLLARLETTHSNLYFFEVRISETDNGVQDEDLLDNDR